MKMTTLVILETFHLEEFWTTILVTFLLTSEPFSLPSFPSTLSPLEEFSPSKAQGKFSLNLPAQFQTPLDLDLNGKKRFVIF